MGHYDDCRPEYFEMLARKEHQRRNEVKEDHNDLRSTDVFPKELPDNDPVNHPKHYTDHPSGIECIQITEHMGFNLGNAVKYLWRCDLKKNHSEDLRKAIWYIERELKLRNK